MPSSVNNILDIDINGNTEKLFAPNKNSPINTSSSIFMHAPHIDSFSCWQTHKYSQYFSVCIYILL